LFAKTLTADTPLATRDQPPPNHTNDVIMADNGMPETEKVNTHIVTLTRFLTEEQAKHKEATGDFT
jgi:hypothetical protein